MIRFHQLLPLTIALLWPMAGNCGPDLAEPEITVGAGHDVLALPAGAGAYSASRIQADQLGADNEAVLRQEGYGNYLSLLQQGYGNQARLGQFGNGNALLVEQIGNRNLVEADQIGDGLRLSILQHGDGMATRMVQQP